MTDKELEQLSGLWRQEPDAEETEALRRAAERIRRRARLSLWAEAVFAILLGAVVILIVAIDPAPGPAIAGGATLAILLVSHIRQRRLRAIELRSLSGTAEQMLDQSIARVEATLKRNRFSLIGLGPGLALGWTLAYFAERNSDRVLVPATIVEPGLRAPVLIVLALILILVFVHLVRAVASCRAELNRLRAMRRTYDEERERFPD